MTDSIGKQEKIIAEVQDLYQPFIQVRMRSPTGETILFQSCRNVVGRGAAERMPSKAWQQRMTLSWS